MRLHSWNSVVFAALTAIGFSAGLAHQPPHGMPTEAPPQDELATYQGPKGDLTIKSVQGTKAGPAAGADEGELVIYRNNAPIKRYPFHLDDQGTTVVKDLPIGLGIRPLVRVKHAGVFYQQIGEMLDTAKAASSIVVTVYEVTDKAPDWRIVLRQVMYESKATGALVAETVIVENPGDATWLGSQPDELGRRSAVRLTLPSASSDVQLQQGFHGWCCTAFKGTELNIQMPLMPGKTTYQFAYTVTADGNKIDLRVQAPAVVEHAAVYVSPKDTVAQAVQLTLKGTETIDNQPAQLYQASDVKAGEAMGIVLATASTEMQTQGSQARAGGSWLPVTVGVVAFVTICGYLVVRAIRR